MKTLVLVPTYNERENIPILVQDILRVPGTVVLVLDDQSPDGTGAVADALARDYPGRVNVLHRTGQRGLGVSYLEGFQHAIKSDADYVVQMDADLSHDKMDCNGKTNGNTRGGGINQILPKPPLVCNA